MAAESAIKKWTSEPELKPRGKIEDPVRLMRGLLKNVRGKTSVELKHQITKDWAKKAGD